MQSGKPVFIHRWSVVFLASTAIVAAASADTFQMPTSSNGTVKYAPAKISGIVFDQIETGATHTIARKGGKIYTWGQSNTFGQLGRQGTLGEPTAITVFEDINGKPIPAPTIVKVAAGDNFGVAIDAQGYIYNWGAIAGNATVARPHRQDWAHNNFSAIDIVAGGGHGLILASDKHDRISLRGFGDNTYGEAGNWSGGTIDLNGTYALNIDDSDRKAIDASAIVSMAAGADHSIIALSNGSVISFGRNEFGELSIGKSVDVHDAAPYRQFIGAEVAPGVPVSNAVKVTAGNGYSLILTADGSVLSVGNNGASQLGRTGNPLFFGATAVNGVNAISAGTNYAVATTSGGDLYEWGFRPTGDTTSATMTNPQVLRGFSNFSLVEAGNMPVDLTRPWNAYFTAQGGGVTAFIADAAPVPVYRKTELFTTSDERAGKDYIGGERGYVRIYSNIVASDGNGPTFTPVSDSPSFWFEGSATVEDGKDYVDIPVVTVPVVAADHATFHILQSNGNTISGKMLTVQAPVANSLTISNLNGLVTFKGGDTLRVAITLPYAAPAEGYDLPFTSNAPDYLPSGTIHVEGGATTAYFDFVAPKLTTQQFLRLQISNVGFANQVAKVTIKK